MLRKALKIMSNGWKMRYEFLKILEEFKTKKIMVIGDIMLDKYIWGNVERISPEAPVPVLKVGKETYNPGGAGNLAKNLTSLGAQVYLSGIVGKDEAKKILFEKLKEEGISTSCILEVSKPTTEKIRGFSHQNLFRIDHEDSTNIGKEIEQELLSLIKPKILEVDAVILVDYAKGVLTKNFVKEAISLAKRNNKLITADCKPMNFKFYEGVDFLKPNRKEAIEMTLVSDIEKAGKLLVKKLNANIVITNGSEGCSVFERDNNNVLHIQTTPKEFYDVSGAGDTFLAVLTLALISNYPLKESAELANQAAGIVVCKPGVAEITGEELKNSFINNIKTIPKKWGEEQLIVNNKKYCGKKMLIKKDHYSSYHMHKIKEETFYILDGKLEIIHKGKYSKLGKERTIHIKPGEYHSFRALHDTIFFEFSTQHLNKDNYRLTKSNFGSHDKWSREIKRVTKNE
ncbi:hypothetical protein CL621_02915 [archaeon]|nr:hypothetical protein [archaeon]